MGGILLNIKEAINFLCEGNYHKNLVIANQNSINCIKECKSLDIPNIVKLNMDEVLLEILKDINDDVKPHESWDLTKKYLNSVQADLLVIYNVDYMFSPDLGNQDIIKNFGYLSRTRNILLFVKGKILGNDLIHSEESFPDYKNMDISEYIVLGW